MSIENVNGSDRITQSIPLKFYRVQFSSKLFSISQQKTKNNRTQKIRKTRNCGLFYFNSKKLNGGQISFLKVTFATKTIILLCQHFLPSDDLQCLLTNVAWPLCLIATWAHLGLVLILKEEVSRVHLRLAPEIKGSVSLVGLWLLNKVGSVLQWTTVCSRYFLPFESGTLNTSKILTIQSFRFVPQQYCLTWIVPLTRIKTR